MILTLPWWTFPVFLVVVGIVLFFATFEQKSDYDFISPLLSAGMFAICFFAAIGFTVAWWVKP